MYSHIRVLIQDGGLKDGMRLPSIHSLRRQLNISKTTIETAYHMLLEEGYVLSKERSGLYVVNPHSTPAERQPEGANASNDPKYPLKAVDQVDKEAVIDFSLLTVDGDSFPIRIWKSIVSESISLNSPIIHQYGDAQGEYSLRESLAEYLRHSRGVVCLPEQIVIGSGIGYSVQLLSRLLEGYIRVGIEEPGIAQVRQVFTQNHFQMIPIFMQTNGQLEHECARSGIQTLYVTPSHRPTGDSLPFAIRKQMLQWAYQTNSYIIEDDYDGELRLSGKPIPSLQGMDSKGVVIYVGTFSKVFTPALRLNYMVLPLQLIEKLHSLKQILTCPSRIDQWAMQLFISRGHWYRHLRRMRKIYRSKQEALIKLIRSQMPDFVQVEDHTAGLHIELSISTSCSAETIIELAANEGVIVYGTQDPHLHQEKGNPKIYLGFGGIKEKEMERGVLLLKKAWSTLSG